MPAAVGSFTVNDTTTNTLSVVADVPASTANGDVLIAAVASGRGTGSPIDVHGSWTDAGTGLTGGTNQHMRALYRVASSEPSSYTFTATGTATDWVVGIIRCTGIDTSGVVIHKISNQGGTGDSPVNPAVVTEVNGCLILHLIVVDASAVPLSVEDAAQPSGDTMLWWRSAYLGPNTSYYAIGGAAYFVQTSAGDTGTATWGPMAASETWSAITIALAPAAGAGVTAEPQHGTLALLGVAPAVSTAAVLNLISSVLEALGQAPTVSVAMTQALPPDAILASTNLTGAVTDIDDDPDSPGVDWLTATVSVIGIDLRVSFPSPEGILTGAQDFKLWLRKTTGSPDPTVDVELWEDGVFVATLLNDVAITSTSGQLFTAPWDASQVAADNDGSLIECRVVGGPT